VPLSPAAYRLPEPQFIVVKNCLSAAGVLRAREVLADQQGGAVSVNDVMLGVYRDSALADIVQDAVGDHPRPTTTFVAITPPNRGSGGRSSTKISPVHAHVDGGYTGLCTLTQTEIYASGQELATWGGHGDANDPLILGPAG
jgi:hypothetical protein